MPVTTSKARQVLAVTTSGSLEPMQEDEKSMIRLAVTVDTEADCQWTAGVLLTTHNIAHCARFQDLCHRYDVVPTYLVTSAVVEDDCASELLDGWRQAGAEIGAHLHPWTTPPYAPRAGLRYNDPVHAYPSQLPDELLFEKTTNLTEQLTARFGTRPTSYRAGRFGFDQRGAQILAATGYQVDSSVTPLTSWASHPGLDGAGGPDFRYHPASPFRIDLGDGGRLTELPVTIVTPHKLLQRSPQLLSIHQSLPGRAVRKLLPGRPHPPPTNVGVASVELHRGEHDRRVSLCSAGWHRDHGPDVP